jgi:hypothetical protein
MAKRPPRDQVVGARFWESVTKEHEATRAEIRFFGVVKRVPVGAFPRKHSDFRAMALEWDESPEALRRDLPPSLPVSMQGWEPLPGATVERYEAFDRETGDLLIFWRVPCRRK